MEHQEFRTKKPREIMELEVSCFADKRMFVREFSDMPIKMQEAFNEGLSIPCAGGGILGMWCQGCPFGEVIGG